jgi:transposase
LLPKSTIVIAINYTLTILENLKRYINDERFEIDNNNIENALRSLAKVIKNYLFVGSHQAAQIYAIFYTFFASCKASDIYPNKWLCGLLNKSPKHKANKPHELQPKI